MTPPAATAGASSGGCDRCIRPPSPRRSGRGACRGYGITRCRPPQRYSTASRASTHIRMRGLCVPVVAAGAAPEVVAGPGELRSDEMADEGFVEPVARAYLHGPEVHGKTRCPNGIPISGSFEGPLVRHGSLGSEVEGSGKSRESVGPHGEELCRSPAGHTPQGRQKQRKNNDFRFHDRKVEYETYSLTQRTGHPSSREPPFANAARPASEMPR